MEYFVRLVEALAWPFTMLLLLWLGRKRIDHLLTLVQKIKFKDFEIEFSKQLEQVKESAQEDPKLIKGDVEPETYALLDVSPSAAILESWRQLEIAAHAKVKALLSPGETFREPLRRPVDYLEHKGALIPSTARAIRGLRQLRNSVAHTSKADVISKGDAAEYVELAATMRKQIEAITELPAVKLTALTLMVLELNHLIDSRKHDDISIDEVYSWIDAKQIIPALKERVGSDADLSMFGSEGPYGNFSAFYDEQMSRMADAYGGDHRRKWGVENSGLCFLLAWTNELIQQGAGWHPREP